LRTGRDDICRTESDTGIPLLREGVWKESPPNTAVIPLQIIRDIALMTNSIHLMMVCANRVDLFALTLFIFGTQWTARLMDY